MNTKKRQSEILRDTAVFEYVAGDKSNGAKQEFERRLADDVELQREVAIERALRKTIAESGKARDQESTVSMDNFDALLSRIDSAELSRNNSAETETIIDNTSTNKEQSEKKNSDNVVYARFGLKQLAAVASIAAVALVSVSFFGDISEPKFETLSSSEQSSTALLQDSFSELVEQRRLAKLVLSEPGDVEAVKQLLAGYQLESLDATPQRGAIVVKAARSIDQQMMAGWLADQRVVSVEIIKFGITE